MNSVVEGTVSAAGIGEGCGRKVLFDTSVSRSLTDLCDSYFSGLAALRISAPFREHKVAKEWVETTFQGDRAVGEEEAHMGKENKYLMNISSNSHKSSKNTNIYGTLSMC